MNTQPEGSADGTGRVRSEDSMSREALEKVLKQTASLNQLAASGDQACLDALLEVARRFPGAEFQLDPILIELVRAALRFQTGPHFQSDHRFGLIVERVAHALFENPETHSRIESFWKQLSSTR